ncbi:MAG: hypothetical protein VX654_12770 [Chloroflexota bacterium]|nr:hypothetical protein [Chloroflexota bacterium]
MLAKPVLKIVDLFQIPKILQVLLRLLTHASILTAEELEAAGSVLGPEAVQYPKVRIAEGGVMTVVFKINGDREMTLFRTINVPAKGHHSRSHLKLLVHEPRKPRVTHTEAGRVWLRNVRAASGLAISTVSS